MEKNETIAPVPQTKWNLYEQQWMTTFMRSWIGLLISFWILGTSPVGLVIDLSFVYQILSSIYSQFYSELLAAPFPFQGFYYLWIGLGIVLLYTVQTIQEQENPQSRPQYETIWSKVKYQLSLLNTPKTYIALGIWIGTLLILIFWGNSWGYPRWKEFLNVKNLGMPGWAFFMIGWAVLLTLLGLTPAGAKLPVTRTHFISIIFSVFFIFGIYLTKLLGFGTQFSPMLRTLVTWFFLAITMLVMLILSFQLNFFEFKESQSNLD